MTGRRDAYSKGEGLKRRTDEEMADIIKQAEERVKRAKIERTEGKGGLDVELHPLLRAVNTPAVLPKNHNPLKQNVRKWFDPTAINPYLNHTSSLERRSKPLQFNPRGKYIAQGDELRLKIRQEQVAKEEFLVSKSKGLVPDESLGEAFYKPQPPPTIEWWDKPFMKANNYNDLTLLDETLITSYVYHPVFIKPLWEKSEELPSNLHLTKQEMKRKRRNERQEKLKIKQDRIKLGLDEPPPPKVKLSNLMNVLTNEAIKDPTAVEQQVRQEVEQRLQQHLQTNEERKLTKEQRHEKIHIKNLKQLDKGISTAVFKIDLLLNPQHKYKLDVNAKQLELVGIILLANEYNLVIVEGSHKNVSFYKKLLLKRINWKENVKPKDAPEDFELADLSKNGCKLIWEGEITDFTFKKWSIMHTRDSDEVFDVLNKFNIENYWRQAGAKDE